MGQKKSKPTAPPTTTAAPKAATATTNAAKMPANNASAAAKSSAPAAKSAAPAATSGGANKNPYVIIKDGDKGAPCNKQFKDLYTLGKELGKGNYSTVRLCVSLANKEECAVKCIVKRKLTPEDDEALKVEVAVLAAVDHPSIIKLNGFFEDPSDYFIVTELMSGGELFDRIVAKEFYSETDAQKVVRTLANCLQYIHNRDIVHRDLKPENILLKDKSDDAAIKIADFGFARYVKEGCRTACGTPGYVAPEIITGKVYGKGVDIWSLGIIIYILLCGYPPFYHRNQAQLFKLIREAKFEFDSPYWDPISDKAKNLIKSCLTVDIDKRLTIDGVLKHPWVAEGVSNTDITPVLGELKKFNARRKLRAAIKAAIAANKMKELAEKFHH